ncbi:MAG: hypothetical protein L0G99_06245 [Propionibacteriales bacterium]|nr:hypothetical protein [Propionibacteriales bacterium]
MSQHPEPTEDEIVGGRYEPYRSHPVAGEIEQVTPRTDARLERHRADEQGELDETAGAHQFVLGIVSLGTGIPISAIAATNVEPGLLGLAVAWAGIVGVNVAHHLSRRRRRR